MKNNIKKTAALITAAAICSVFTAGCGKTAESAVIDNEPSTLAPVYYLESGNSYSGVAPVVEETVETFTSADELCTIEKKKSYSDVTLDYTKGDHYSVGAAYAEALMKAYPDYPEMAEPYIYENIHEAFSAMKDDYSGVQERVDKIKASLNENYRREMEGFAEKMSEGRKGFERDGKISYDEICLMSLVPDVLRGTSCSAISVNGNKTASGERISARLLEWNLGSSNQICSIHCVLHIKNGSKSFTGISSLGVLDVITGVNTNGVFAGILDVGSAYGASFVIDGKTSYTYALRYALENYSTAREAGEYLTENSDKFTWDANVFLSDKNEVCCAELVVDDESGAPTLRDSSTPLNKGVTWDDKDSFCVVNSYAAEGNFDNISIENGNAVRWEKYKKFFCSEKDITQERFKELITAEKISRDFINIRSRGLVQLIMVDYSDHSIQVAFTGTEGVVDKPDFINVGKYD